MRELSGTDRVGLGWRPELAAGDPRAPRPHRRGRGDRRRPLRRRRAPSCARCARWPRRCRSCCTACRSASPRREPVDERRLDARGAPGRARSRPEFWSEHLAFVRGGGVEIGHLAAPPRTAATVEGTARNVERARAVVGAAPLLENVASLDRPARQRPRRARLDRARAEAAGVDLLLDLHNLLRERANFGFDARAFLDRAPGRARARGPPGGRALDHGRGRRRACSTITSTTCPTRSTRCSPSWRGARRAR